MTVISCYSPNVSSEDERQALYEDLMELTKSIPKHNVILEGGETNAKVGETNAKGWVYNDTR